MMTASFSSTRETASFHGGATRAVAYISMEDAAARSRVIAILERAGWAVIPQPTGFHLLSAIAGLIDGNEPWLRPSLIVIDAHARGCAGTTIATGLRELGITIPIMLVVAPGQPRPITNDTTVRIIESEDAEHAIADLVRPGRAPRSAA